MITTYNDGNLTKYTSKNPLKRALVDNLNQKIIANIAQLAIAARGGTTARKQYPFSTPVVARALSTNCC